MSWDDYASAPPRGTEICPADAITDATSIVITSERGSFPVILVRRTDGVRGFVNACPHHFLPLDYHGRQILSADRTRLLCSVHGAQFCADSGEGVHGEGLGCRLEAVPLEILDGMVMVAREAGADAT